MSLPPRAPSIRSLSRGLEILRSFRPGVGVLSNGQIVQRTGLPKATVSRLTQTLVAEGFLRHDPVENAYRLGYVLLSLGHAVGLDSELTATALPFMQALAESRRVNVGLSAGDQLDMVYLAAVELDDTRSTRRFAPGLRKPIASTAIGRAYLGALPSAERAALLERLRQAHPDNWRRLEAAIGKALDQLGKKGFCDMPYGDVVSVATPIRLAGYAPCVLNMSFNTVARLENRQWGHLAELLLSTAAELEGAMTAKLAE